jgi:hypothetical protein
MSFPVRKLALMGVLTALAIALKLPILSIPNVEFLTFVVFSAGFLVGMVEGTVVGIIAMSIYTTLIAPYGIPPAPIAAAQVLSMGLIGFSGGLARGLTSAVLDRNVASHSIHLLPVLAGFGLVLTLIYDLLTNLAWAFVMGQFWPVMVVAIPFALIHLVSNVVIFLVLSPVLVRLSRSSA